jgi:cytochrome c oxidase subunit II
MSSLGLINEFLGQPPNASEHGFQIDHIIEFSHWFMGALFVGWSVFFIFVLIRFHKSRHPKADTLEFAAPSPLIWNSRWF